MVRALLAHCFTAYHVFELPTAILHGLRGLYRSYPRRDIDSEVKYEHRSARGESRRN